MPLYTYTGTLTDIGLRTLAWAFPVLRVRPEREAYGPNGLIAAAPMTVDVNATTGAFSMQLLASTDMTPQTDYIIEVGRFENSIDGQRFIGFDTWRFTAVPGGGSLSELAGLQIGNDLVWVDDLDGEPDLSKRTGLQLDVSPGETLGDLYQWKA